MANPTTNYGWPMPTSTDLVTDLPADFAAFGQPVDTTLKALNPETTLGDIAYRSATSNTNTRLGIGTNGQVLAVSGGVPAWTTTSDVTPLTTKGDLFTFDTADARLAVGTNGQTLVADSSTSTGLKWATPSGVTFSGCRAIKSATQTITSASTFTSVSFDGADDYDTASYHNPSTNNSRFIVPSTGYYLFSMQWQGNDSLVRNYRYLKNGTTVLYYGANSNTGTNLYGFGPSLVGQFYLAANDYIEIQMWSLTTSSNIFGTAALGDPGTTMQVTYLGA